MAGTRFITILSIAAIILLCGTLFALIGLSAPNEEHPQSASTSMQPQKSELKIEVLQEGTGVQITNGQTAFVYYIGSLDDGKAFDQNQSGPGFSFPLGAGRVIQGWDVGVLGMKVGEKRRLTIPPSLGYGAGGFPGVIPPNATLHFDVELKAIE